MFRPISCQYISHPSRCTWWYLGYCSNNWRQKTVCESTKNQGSMYVKICQNSQPKCTLVSPIESQTSPFFLADQKHNLPPYLIGYIVIYIYTHPCDSKIYNEGYIFLVKLDHHLHKTKKKQTPHLRAKKVGDGWIRSPFCFPGVSWKKTRVN